MVLKAARGAGVPLGHCEDLAAAAGYIAATDPEALSIFGTLLGASHGALTCVSQRDSLTIPAGSIAVAGPLAVDAIGAGFREVRLSDASAPTIVFALFAVQGIAVVHHFDGADLVVAKTSDAPPPVPLAGPAVVSEQLWQTLGYFAAKTYVPASDASRIAGAGAGLTDND
tara:strand:+ start:31960 stop:32469 length:510 start_codon:yes stop_codon:yes gene_type:complete